MGTRAVVASEMMASAHEKVFKGWIFFLLVNWVGMVLIPLSEGGEMSCAWKGLFPPHRPGLLGRETQPITRDPILSPCFVTQHPALVQNLSFPTAVRESFSCSIL